MIRQFTVEGKKYYSITDLATESGVSKRRLLKNVGVMDLRWIKSSDMADYDNLWGVYVVSELGYGDIIEDYAQLESVLVTDTK